MNANADVTVRDVMSRDYVGVSESDGVVETVELLLEEGVDSAVVLRGSEPVGVLTGRDVLALLPEDDVEEATVADAMSAAVPTVPPDRGIVEAAAVMETAGARGLLVTDGNEPLGLVTERDLFAAATIEAPREPERSELLSGDGAVAESRPTADETFANQSICEECGAFARNLADVGGHLVCPDCRSM